MTVVAFGVWQAVEPVVVPVDLSQVRFDPDLQVSVIEEDGIVVPVLKHSTGKTSTNTARRDNQGGADTDSDHTED